MSLERITSQSLQPMAFSGQPARKLEEESLPLSEDMVSLSDKGDNLPRIMVGAPTARLGPRIDEPNVHPSIIGIEITNGVAIGIDGEAILVGPGKEGRIEVKGAPVEDGAYPQRNYDVDRKGSQAEIKSFYGWQNYRLTEAADSMHMAGETDRESCDVRQVPQGIDITGKWPVQNSTVRMQGKEALVKGYDEMYSARLTTDGNVTAIKTGDEERDLTVTREKNHMKIDGKYAYQDFDISWDDRGIFIKGYYPQQSQTILFKA